MATRMLGSVGAFEEGAETWALYQERLEQFFVANDIEDTKKRAVLLSTCGRNTYQLISRLLAPGKPSETAYSVICDRLKNHYDPRPSELVLRSRFYGRSRRKNESIADFLAELRGLAKECNFGDQLNSLLRDRLSLGINDETIRSNLLAEAELSLEKAFSIALAHESATLSTRHVVPIESEVQAISHTGPSKRCYRCLSMRHMSANCPFLKRKCFKCSKLGHAAVACRVSPANVKERHQRVQEVGSEAESTASEEQTYSLHHVTKCSNRVPPFMATVLLEGKPVTMEIDTGASVSLISSETFASRLGNRPRLQPDKTKLRTYSGELVPVLGRVEVRVETEGVSKRLPLLVVKGAGSDLLGRDWLASLPVDWCSIKQVQHEDEHPCIHKLLEDFASVFEPGLGQYSGPPVRLQLKAGARPRFMKARCVPLALKDKVEAQLDKEIERGVLRPVSSSDYASPIVPVLKRDGSIRICADFKRTVNLYVEPDTYPLPRIEEIFAKLTGGRRFSKLDLSQAYSQLPLDESSQAICTINTTKGLLRYTRLPFGVAPAVGIFQRRMDCLLQGIPNVACFIDDLIVTGPDDGTHLKTLEQVLERLRHSGLKCGRAKCSFMQQSVCYLGHRIDASGLHPLQEKVRAILEAPTPKDTTQLRSLLGLVNYYAKFLPNLSTVLSPLHGLLNKGTKWHWTKEHDAPCSIACGRNYVRKWSSSKLCRSSDSMSVRGIGL